MGGGEAAAEEQATHREMKINPTLETATIASASYGSIPPPSNSTQRFGAIRAVFGIFVERARLERV
jgi:hypothetical protein